jgi:hypothetical protein
MSQTARDCSEKRNFICIRVFADKKGGLDGRLFQFTGRDQKSSST